MQRYHICHYKVQFHIFWSTNFKGSKMIRSNLNRDLAYCILDPKNDSGSGSNLRSNFFGGSSNSLEIPT